MVSKNTQLNHTRLFQPTPELATDREAALDLLHTCVATGVRCVAEVVRHVRADPNVSNRLLEDLLAVENGHADELMHVLRVHRVGI